MAVKWRLARRCLVYSDFELNLHIHIHTKKAPKRLLWRQPSKRSLLGACNKTAKPKLPCSSLQRLRSKTEAPPLVSTLFAAHSIKLTSMIDYKCRPARKSSGARSLFRWPSGFGWLLSLSRRIHFSARALLSLFLFSLASCDRTKRLPRECSSERHEVVEMWIYLLANK